jgi:hypothetical protein
MAERNKKAAESQNKKQAAALMEQTDTINEENGLGFSNPSPLCF